jgi:hypothetical protein
MRSIHFVGEPEVNGPLEIYKRILGKNIKIDIRELV